MSEADSPWNPSELRATIKFGRDYDAPWLTVGGNTIKELRERLAEAGGLEDWKDLTLNEIGALVNRDAITLYSVSKTLGATPIKSTTPESAPGKPSEPPVSASQPARVESPAPDNAGTLEAISKELAEATDMAGVNVVWAKYKEEFQTIPEVKPLFAQRQKALQSSK